MVHDTGELDNELVCLDSAGSQAAEPSQCKAEITCESSCIGDEETCEEETWEEEHCSNTGKDLMWNRNASSFRPYLTICCIVVLIITKVQIALLHPRPFTQTASLRP